jgi:GMP synthase-like glutamine amidotransferase
MKVLVIQNCQIEDIGTYEDYFQDKNIDYTVVRAYDGRELPSIEYFDAFVVGGTPISVYKAHRHDFLRRELAYVGEIVKLDSPCLGICGGGQMVAKVLGAQVRKNPVMEIGGYYVQLTPAGKNSKFFNGLPDQFPVFHWHGDTFDVPKGAELLVEGVDCRNQAFCYRRALALQFHLEVSPSIVSRWADEYSSELERIGKTKMRVVEECRIKEKQMKKLTYLLLDNFFAIAESGQ